MTTWKTKGERVNLVLTQFEAEYINRIKRQHRFPIQTSAILHQLIQTAIEKEEMKDGKR
jgi:hypothetical protein